MMFSPLSVGVSVCLCSLVNDVYVHAARSPKVFKPASWWRYAGGRFRFWPLTAGRTMGVPLSLDSLDQNDDH